ncbi:NmrA-like family domain-containing protein 1 [Rhizoctonia solani]|uniref:NmrA-like family domain-containing protein 1 n=1 Tax=Rhizoctonia solani TaxID=456999 RepID=A0A8H8NQG6_9AGAM|nr:NmrA-like family domain-containing protein 1 [Rhizoctonia solani]QRW16427.1 NmrA-like family domain-containing protein 1 [Rhizoctonia solani]
MSAKVVALAGANGYVGKALADAFLDLNPFQVRLLVRNESINTTPYQDYKKRGALLYAVSYDDEASLVKALDGVDVLVSSVAAAALTSTQKAGVKVFFPSEFSGNFPDDVPFTTFRARRDVLESAKEHGLPVARLNTGGFPEYIFELPLGLRFADKKITIWGEGNTKVSWTTMKSVADWLANVLKSVPVTELQNKDIAIQGSSLTLNEIVKTLGAKHNVREAPSRYRPLKEMEDRIAADPTDLLAFLVRGFEVGHGNIGGEGNGLYPDWKPESVESVL